MTDTARYSLRIALMRMRQWAMGQRAMLSPEDVLQVLEHEEAIIASDNASLPRTRRNLFDPRISFGFESTDGSESDTDDNYEGRIQDEPRTPPSNILIPDNTLHGFPR